MGKLVIEYDDGNLSRILTAYGVDSEEALHDEIADGIKARVASYEANQTHEIEQEKLATARTAVAEKTSAAYTKATSEIILF